MAENKITFNNGSRIGPRDFVDVTLLFTDGRTLSYLLKPVKVTKYEQVYRYEGTGTGTSSDKNRRASVVDYDPDWVWILLGRPGKPKWLSKLKFKKKKKLRISCTEELRIELESSSGTGRLFFFTLFCHKKQCADPGCLSRIRICPIPDPNFFHPESRIRIKEF